MGRPLVRGVTIDPIGSKDLDDAVWVEETQDGLILHISISDATSWVQLGSEADLRAHDRIVSRYYNNHTDHLLPNEIATDLGSLVPGQPRRALTLVIELDSELNVVGQPQVKLTYAECSKLSYSDVPAILRNPGDPLFQQVGLLSLVAKALARKRGQHTPIPFYELPKGWVVTEEGLLREIPALETTGHVIVRELMVLANATLARWCKTEGIPIIYRTHLLRKGVVDLAGFVAQNGDGKLDFKRIHLVREQMGLVVPRARYDTNPHQHAGLGLSVYTHGSSPLRRRADMIVHRQIKAWIKHRVYPYDEDDLRVIADHINERAYYMDESNPNLHRRWEPKVKVSEKPTEALQSWAQKVGIPQPTYSVSVDDGHRKPYVALCTLGNLKRTGRGANKTEAKKNAAKAVYDVLFAHNR